MLTRKVKQSTRRNLLILMALMCLALVLAACGDPTATTPLGVVGASPIPNTPTTAPATTAAAVTTTAPTTNSSNPSSSTPQATQPGFNPLIRFSTATIKGKGNMTVSGSGYPASTKLAIKLVKDGANPNLFVPLSNPVTDGKGNFSAVVSVATPESGAPLDPGKWVVLVATQDGKVAAGAPITIEKDPSYEVYNPVLGVSRKTVSIGDSFELQGGGFPTNANLKIAGGVQNPGITFALIKSDNAGTFAKVIKMDVEPTQRAIPFQPGPYTFVVYTEDGRGLGSVTITLVARPDESTQLANAFFNKVLADDNAGAAKFLSAKQQARIQNGQTTIPQLLHLARKPNSVEVFASDAAKGYNYKALMHFAGGDRLIYLLIGSDSDGSTKIIDFSEAIDA